MCITAVAAAVVVVVVVVVFVVASLLDLQPRGASGWTEARGLR